MTKKLTPVAMGLRAFVFIISATVSSAQAPDPLVGTWTLNLTKSKYATPAPKRMTITFAPAAKGYVVSIDAIGPDGQSQKWGPLSGMDVRPSTLEARDPVLLTGLRIKVVSGDASAEGRNTRKTIAESRKTRNTFRINPRNNRTRGKQVRGGGTDDSDRGEAVFPRREAGAVIRVGRSSQPRPLERADERPR